MITLCNNISNTHSPRLIKEEADGVRYICDICKGQFVLRIGTDGRMDNREYTKVFKKDLLQPHDNLFFKIFPERMSVI
jgi:hypothetical protein